MKILFLHVYSEYNTGDAAIVEVMLDDYRTRYPDAEIILSSITKPSAQKFHGASYVSSFFYEAIYRSDNTLNRIWRTCWIIVGSVVHGITYKLTGISIPFIFSENLQIFTKTLREADLVVCVGGGYIIGKHSWKSTLSLFLTLLEIWYAKKIRKIVHLYSQSIGPFEKPFQLKMARYVLNQVDQITVRENLSRQLLTDMGITSPKIKRAYDAAFYFSARTKTRMKNYLMKKGIFFTKKVIGFTVRNSFPVELQQTYEQAIAATALYAVEELGYKVVFIPHVTAIEQNDDDREVQKRIQSHLKPNRDIIFLYDRFTHTEVKGIYDNLDLLVGTRMHSVIFALTGGVPSLAIAYEPKTIGIMKQLGLEECVIIPEEIHYESLIKAIVHLHTHIDHYRNRLSKQIQQM